MSFNEVLKNLRMSKGVAQVQVADSLGIAKSTYSMYESGNREPNMEMLKKIARYFDVSLDYLLETTANNELYDIINKLGQELENMNIPPAVVHIQAQNNNRTMLNQYFDMLNEAGQNKAVDQVEMLTKINEYRKVPKTSALFEGIGKNSNEIADIIKDAKPTP